MKAYRGVDGKIRLFRPDLNMKRMLTSAERSVLPVGKRTNERWDRENIFPRVSDVRWQRIVGLHQKIDRSRCRLGPVVEIEYVVHSTDAERKRGKTRKMFSSPTKTFSSADIGCGRACRISSLRRHRSRRSVFSHRFQTGVSAGRHDSLSSVSRWHGRVQSRIVSDDEKEKHETIATLRNYGPTIYVNKEANAKGCQQVLWLHGPERYITEVGTMNVFMCLKNKKGPTTISRSQENRVFRSRHRIGHASVKRFDFARCHSTEYFGSRTNLGERKPRFEDRLTSFVVVIE